LARATPPASACPSGPYSAGLQATAPHPPPRVNSSIFRESSNMSLDALIKEATGENPAPTVRSADGMPAPALPPGAMCNGSGADALLTGDEAEVSRILQICNACRYCEGFCAVFPAMTRRLEFNKADINYMANLCH